MLRPFSMPLGAEDPAAKVWTAMLTGAGAGLAWGVAIRIWMRLISTRPEFTVAGTGFILGAGTIFGLCAGLAYAARRHGWRGWRHYAPRIAVFVTFLPFGFGGGGPMMAAGMLGTLALTQSALVAALLLSGPAAVVGLSGLNPQPLALSIPAVAAAIAGWTWIAARTAQDSWVRRSLHWADRAVRLILLAGALALIGGVGREIINDKPEPRSYLYILLYLILLCPMYVGLRIGVAPRGGK